MLIEPDFNKERYRDFCNKEKDIPIFSKDYWLDAVCGEHNWHVIMLKESDQIIASFPYQKVKKLGINIITKPRLTQTLGIYIKYPDTNYNKKKSFEKRVLKKLIETLPKFGKFSASFHYNFTNWLPFYWAGYSQMTRYTYVIENLINLDNVYSGFRSNIKSDIKKAQKNVKVIYSNDIEKFYEINKMTFERQNIRIPYGFEYIKRIDDACVKNNCRQIFFAIDDTNQVHAAVYIVWDNNSAYYLMSGGNPKLRNSGATSLLLWEAIQFASTVTKKFDFEGSMIESIEKYFNAFGATQKQYFNIYKINSLLIKFQNFIVSL